MNTDRTVFLDRDGTINEEVNYLYRPEDLKLLKGVAEAIRMLNEAGFQVIVITNQAGVGRGYYTESDVETLHQFLNSQLKKEGAHIDAFYYCPHHPEHGIGIYKVKCQCRKPETGMFLMAEKDFSVDKGHSYMVGDKLIDAEAGRNYGVTTVLVGTGYGKKIYQRDQENNQMADTAYDYYAENLKKAAKWIIDREAKDCLGDC